LGHQYDASVSGPRPGKLRQRNRSGSIDEAEKHEVSPERVKKSKKYRQLGIQLEITL
jgi:hypothetical protein